MLPNPIIKIGSLEIYMYGVCIAIGVIMAIVILRLYGKKLKVNPKLLDFVELDGYASIAIGFLFSALFQAVYNYIENPEAGFKFGGITFLGGLIGGAATFFIIYFSFKKKRNLLFRDVIDIIPCSILIGHGFGRIGCFCSGCCYGIEVEPGHWYSWMGVDFPEVPGVVFPTQLFEAIILFILFGILSVLCLKRKGKQNFSIYLIAYGIFRYLIEYIRGDERGEFIPGISPSQFWSIIMVLMGIGLIFFTKYVLFKDKKELAIEGLKVEEEKVEALVEVKEEEKVEPRSDLEKLAEDFEVKTETLVEVKEEKKEPAKKATPKKTTAKAGEKKPAAKKTSSTKKSTSKKPTTKKASEKKETVKKTTPKKEEVKEEKKVIEKKENPFEKKSLVVDEEITKEDIEKEDVINEEEVDDKHMERMRKQLLAQKKLREEVPSEEPKKSVSLEEKLGNKKK